jgi:hypothetical protein
MTPTHHFHGPRYADGAYTVHAADDETILGAVQKNGKVWTAYRLNEDYTLGTYVDTAQTRAEAAFLLGL